MTHTPFRAAALLAVLAALISGCGSSTRQSASSTQASSSTTTAAATAAPSANLVAAEHPSASQFPPARGRTLQQLGNLASSAAQLGAATGVFTPGVGRVAFGITTTSGAFAYGPTALYISTSPSKPASGPYLAPADPMGVAPQYRSQQNTGPNGIQAIYAAHVPLPHAGTFTILALTKVPGGLLGSPGEVAVAPASPIPAVGQRPPAIATDTPASVGGHTDLLTTRIPPDDMHAVSFNDVLGKKPIVLLFSTPQLCQSRVCGPVTDIAVALEHQYGNRVVFIHQEVYVNNQPKQGLRPQLKAFHLQTEPWLFTVNRQGKIAARLEGAFGVNEFTRAIQAALQ